MPEVATVAEGLRGALEADVPHKPVEVGSNPAPATTPTGTPPWEEKKPAKKRKSRKQIKHISEEVLDSALLLFKGDRKAAAAYLKITRPSLHFRIEYYPALKAKWSGEAMNYQRVLKNAETAGCLAEAQINAAYSQTSLIHQKLFADVISLEKQIEMGERARLNPDDKEAQKFRFRVSDKGEPIEEKVLREAKLATMKLHLETTQSFLDAALTTAKIAALRNGKGGGSGRGEPGKGGQPGFGAKRVIEVKA